MIPTGKIAVYTLNLDRKATTCSGKSSVGVQDTAGYSESNGAPLSTTDHGLSWETTQQDAALLSSWSAPELERWRPLKNLICRQVAEVEVGPGGWM
jgi:hypothetical protein